jgi:hypothetical protein
MRVVLLAVVVLALMHISVAGISSAFGADQSSLDETHWQRWYQASHACSLHITEPH